MLSIIAPPTNALATPRTRARCLAGVRSVSSSARRTSVADAKRSSGFFARSLMTTASRSPGIPRRGARMLSLSAFSRSCLPITTTLDGPSNGQLPVRSS